jgi:hypothetical protein
MYAELENLLHAILVRKSEEKQQCEKSMHRHMLNQSCTNSMREFRLDSNGSGQAPEKAF